MSPHNDDRQDDRDATNYAATPPASADAGATHYSGAPTSPEIADGPTATRYSDAHADPHATAYTPTSGASDNTAGRLPRRFGGYELLEELGHGGMGVVYKARQLAPERMVALKVIRSGELADAEDVRRFRQEADEAARLDHPHIVPVYEVGEHGGLHFFTMKLVEGGSLSQHLERYQNDPKAAARLMAMAARAVHYAHQRQLLHRDLKPGNILLDPAGQPHVADFGLAKRMEEGDACVTRSNAVVGTPEYMAPEQARSEKRLTTAADVYALGGVLYALLTGRPPFRGDSAWATIEKVLTEEPTPPSKVRTGVPRDLETICLKCLAKEPARRYGSAEGLAEDLERWLRGEPIKGRPVGRMERAWMWCRRNPTAALLSTAFVTALLLGAGVSTYFAVESNANYQEARKREKDTKEALEKVTEREKQVSEANAQLEETLARGLLRPLGHQAEKVTDPEIEALWDLAGSNRRVRLLFAEQALRRPSTARQLANRADMAVRAAVGLDPARRQEVENLLLAQLRDREGDFDFRTDCMRIGASLGGGSREFAGATARQAVEAMAKTNDPVALDALADAVPSLAPRLGAGEASAAARQAAEAMAKTNDPGDLHALAYAVASLAPRLRPEEAAWRASAADRLVLETMAKTNDPDTLRALAGAVASLAPRLRPEEASARQASAAARQILEAMATNNPDHLYALGDAVADLAPRLGPEDASAAARQVVEAMGKTTNSVVSRALVEAVAALIVKPGPSETSQRTSLLGWAVGNTVIPSPFLPGLAPLMEASRPPPGRFTEQQLVNLLKLPTCHQPARQVIVRQLGWQCGQPFADQWEFVEWAHEHRPDLDLTSPPVRLAKP